MLRNLLIIIAFLPSLAFAADPLTRAEVENFTKAGEQMQALADKYPEIEDNFTDYDVKDAMKMFDKMFAADGSVRLFSVVMEQIDEYPQARGDVEQTVRKAGFKSMNHYEQVGNRLMAAMMASEMSKSDLESMNAMASMPEAQLNMVPAAMRPMIEMAPKIVAAIKRVPPSDVKLVKELKPFEQMGQ